MIDLKSKVKELKLKAFDRAIICERGHLGGSYSCAEFLIYLYYSGLFKYDALNPKWDKRDYFILSKGHSSNVFHEILYDRKYITEEQLGKVSGHCDFEIPGIEATTGSLGHGLGIAAGIALGLKIDDKHNKVICVIGDGELQEGSTWEALHFIKHHELYNLLVVIDLNTLGSEDFTDNTCNHRNLKERLRSMYYNVRYIDGHHIDDISAFMEHWYNSSLDPSILIMNTIKGKGLITLAGTSKSHHHLPVGEDIGKCRRSLQDE